VFSIEDEAVIVAFRRHTLLPLDDCLYALQPTIPHLSRSALHRCLQRHSISRLPEVGGDKPAKKPFKRYPIGYFHIDLAEVRTAEGKLNLFVAIDRTSKFAFVRLEKRAGKMEAAQFLRDLLQAPPYRIHTGSDRQLHSIHQPGLGRARLRPRLSQERDRTPPHQGEASLNERPSRADESHDQGSHRQTLSLR
jgi:hypothetical protein